MFNWLKKILIDPTFEEIQAAYQLKSEISPFPVISGSACPKVWAGQCKSTYFSIRTFGTHWEVMIGEIIAISDLELSNLRAQKKARKFELPQEIKEQVTVPTGKLADRFAITMICHEQHEFHGPQLKDPVIEKALMKISDVVSTVILYRRGVELQIKPKEISRAKFDDDLRAGCEIAKALQLRHPMPVQPSIEP